MLKRYSKNFWLLSFSSYLFFSSFTMIIPELPAYLSRMGGEEYIGLIIALFTLTAGISRPFSGKLTDKWGRIPVMVVGAMVSGIAALLYPVLITVPGFLLLRLFHGFSTGFKPTGTSAIIADMVPANRRGEALGISSFFGSIGMASGPAIGSWIYLEFGINTLFYASAAFAFASVGILIGMKETLADRSPFSLSMLKIKRSDIYEPTVLTPSVVMILTTLAFGTVITLAPDFSDFLHIKNRGLFFIVFTSSSLLVRVIGGQLSDRFGRRSVLRFSTLILFVSMTVLGFSTDTHQFFTGAFLFGIGYGLNSPTLFAWTIDLSPEAKRGKGVATLFIFLEVGIGLGALISGTVYQGHPERFPLIFGTAGLFSFLAFLYLQFFTRK
ncbi:MFS transporter [Marinoscillum furvescens]|uniref:Putative MFS family arabinose efflux permease n=1 Tax=Marinoscillum furvescens DSM 4134 TaxID=1122208 RepID=A0A3D9L5H2_MARFU|nr:MFS transporter [Marinoscillum furvescens]RED99791.1 putative MFS family arabinose efflux permease [Marinoscillum furvescens DSM 4134]